LYEDCRRSRTKRDHFLFKKLLRALIEIWNKLSERSNLSVSKLTQSCRYRAQILQNLRFSRITIRRWQALALRPNRFRRNPLLRRHTLVMRNRQKDSRTSKEGPHTLPGRKVIRICFLEQQKLTIRDLTALYPTPGTLYMQIRRSTANTKHFTLSSCNTFSKNLTTVRRLRSVSRTRSCKQTSCKCNSLSLSLSLSLSAHSEFLNLSQKQQHYQGIWNPARTSASAGVHSSAFTFLLTCRVYCTMTTRDILRRHENLSSISLPRSLITLHLSLSSSLFFSLL